MNALKPASKLACSIRQPNTSNTDKRDGISGAGLEHFRVAYPGEPINKEGLFHYLYGLLHSEDYRERFRNNLMKRIPRIPAVASFQDFEAFRSAGRGTGRAASRL